MIAKKGPAIWAIVVALTLSLSAWGAGQRRNQQQGQSLEQLERQTQQQNTKAPQSVGPQAKTKDEADAFNNMQKEQDPAKRIELSEAFIAKFPDSDLVSFAHTYLVTSYSQLGKHKEAVAAAEQAIDASVKYGEKLVAKADADSKLTDKEKDAIKKKDKNATFVDKNSPQYQTFMSQTDQRILALHQSIIQSYQALNDAPKMMEWGEKALAYKPDDINTMAMLSNVMAERPPVNEDQKQKQMKRAEEIVNQALTVLPTYLSSPEGAKLQAEQKTDLTAQLHYTLGLIYLHEKRLGSSQQEFLAAVKSKPNDPITYYRLAIAYVQDMKNDQAMDALGKSVFLKGVSEANARELLKQLYVQKNKSEQGIDDYIKTAGGKIGQ
jgi:tetratricopeptide (TPR) repeat protein